MSAIAAEKTVAEVAAENPAAIPVFEKLGIDYCCGGSSTLSEACRAAGLSLERVADEIEATPGTASVAYRDWRSEPLSELIAHIRTVHHEYTRAALARIAPLFEKVYAVHGGNHSELEPMREVFTGLAQELATHLMKEERILFPYIERMEEAVVEKSVILPPPFGTVENPVAMMMREHDGAGDALRDLRAASNNYTAPPDACTSFRALYQALGELGADLHQHIHLENNVLFPRAIEMERSGQRRV